MTQERVDEPFTEDDEPQSEYEAPEPRDEPEDEPEDATVATAPLTPPSPRLDTPVWEQTEYTRVARVDREGYGVDGDGKRRYVGRALAGAVNVRMPREF